MKALIAIVFVVAVIFGAWKTFEYWDKVSQEKELKQQAADQAKIDPRQLPGLPPTLEDSLAKAYQDGAKGLKSWLDQYKRAPLIKDPRLAWIELDYVLLLTQEDPAEARKVFAQVKERTPPDSPIYPRVQQMAKTYD